MLPSLGSLSINDAKSAGPLLDITEEEDIGANGRKMRKIDDEMSKGDPDGVEWWIPLEGSPPDNPVYTFNIMMLNDFMRKANTDNWWIYWYPKYPGSPGIFSYLQGEFDFSSFVPHNIKNNGLKWDTTHVDGKGTYHPDPHYLRDNWVSGFKIKILKPELQKKRFLDESGDPGTGSRWYVGWLPSMEPEENLEEVQVPGNKGCPATKSEMVAPFLKWCKEQHVRTNDMRRKKNALWDNSGGKHRDFKIKQGPRAGEYRKPDPPLEWDPEKFDELLQPWLDDANDVPEGNKLDEFSAHVRELDPARGSGPDRLEPPPGFLVYKKSRATVENVPKPGQPKPKDRSFKTDEAIFIGPRWKQWLKGREGEQTNKGYVMVREMSPKNCWLTYMNAQSSGTSAEPNKVAAGASKLAADDAEGKAKVEKAAFRLEKNREVCSRSDAYARAKERQEARPSQGGAGGSNDPMPGAAADKPKKDAKRKKGPTEVPSSSEDDDDEEEGGGGGDDEDDSDDDDDDAEAQAVDIRQPLAQKAKPDASRPSSGLTVEKAKARRLARAEGQGSDSSSDDDDDDE